jgi:hypothetical protein
VRDGSCWLHTVCALTHLLTPNATHCRTWPAIWENGANWPAAWVLPHGFMLGLGPLAKLTHLRKGRDRHSRKYERPGFKPCLVAYHTRYALPLARCAFSHCSPMPASLAMTGGDWRRDVANLKDSAGAEASRRGLSVTVLSAHCTPAFLTPLYAPLVMRYRQLCWLSVLAAAPLAPTSQHLSRHLGMTHVSSTPGILSRPTGRPSVTFPLAPPSTSTLRSSLKNFLVECINQGILTP